MNATQYLQEVIDTVASCGNQGNDGFLAAASVANQWLGVKLSPEVQLSAARLAKDAVQAGLRQYVPGAKWFSPATAIEYASLVSKFNSIAAPSAEPLSAALLIANLGPTRRSPAPARPDLTAVPALP